MGYGGTTRSLLKIYFACSTTPLPGKAANERRLYRDCNIAIAQPVLHVSIVANGAHQHKNKACPKWLSVQISLCHAFYWHSVFVSACAYCKFPTLTHDAWRRRC